MRSMAVYSVITFSVNLSKLILLMRKRSVALKRLKTAAAITKQIEQKYIFFKSGPYEETQTL